MKVALRAVGGVTPELLAALSKTFRESGIECEVRGSIPPSRAAFDPRARKYRAEALLAAIPGDDADRVLAVTSEDLYAEGLKFVFGLATIGGPAAIVSVCRLQDPNPSVVGARLAKEAVHELGHTFGLPHCPTARCVMRFSNSLPEVDAKGLSFCGSCREKLPPEWAA